jgi:hypothetical protein
MILTELPGHVTERLKQFSEGCVFCLQTHGRAGNSDFRFVSRLLFLTVVKGKADYLTGAGKIVFQSSFMLITIQPFFFASAMSASLNVPIFDSAP